MLGAMSLAYGGDLTRVESVVPGNQSGRVPCDDLPRHRVIGLDGFAEGGSYPLATFKEGQAALGSLTDLGTSLGGPLTPAVRFGDPCTGFGVLHLSDPRVPHLGQGLGSNPRPAPGSGPPGDVFRGVFAALQRQADILARTSGETVLPVLIWLKSSRVSWDTTLPTGPSPPSVRLRRTPVLLLRRP